MAGTSQHAIEPVTPELLCRIAAAIEHPLLRLYTRLRFQILPLGHFESINRFLPAEGLILDVACGWGLFAMTFAQTHPGARVLGCDLHARRLATGRRLIERMGLRNVELIQADVREWRAPAEFSGACLFFILHHLPREKAVELLIGLTGQLPVGGRLVLEEILTRPRWKAWFCRVMDVIHMGDADVHYWTLAELTAVLEALGYDTEARDITNWTPYPHGLFLAARAREVTPEAARDALCPGGVYRDPSVTGQARARAG